VGLKEDAQRIREELTRLVKEDGNDVIVIAHSYGGMVINEAANPEFAKPYRTERGEPGGVLIIIYMTAYAVPIGVNLVTPIGGTPPSMLLEVITAS